MLRTDNFGLLTSYTDHKNNSGSNLANLIRSNGFKDFSPHGISSFLTFRYPVNDYTMFQGYKRVPFGHRLQDKVFIEGWRPRFTTVKSMDFDKNLNMLDSLLRTAIRGQYTTGQIGVPLSGGVDSSLIVAILRDIFPNKAIHTYTAGFGENDEFKYAKQVAEKFKTIHHEYVLNVQHFFLIMHKLIEFKGEPLHPNEIPLAYIESKAKQHGCSTIMCGEGADDIFGGYSHLLCLHHNYWHFKDRMTFEEYFLNNYRYFTLKDREKNINPKYLIPDIHFINDPTIQYGMPEELNNRTLYYIQKLHTPGLITRGVNAIKYSHLMPSFPYIHPIIVDFVNSMPFEWKLPWVTDETPVNIHTIPYKDIADNFTEPKYILKKLAEKYLPHDIVYRKKVAFPVSFNKWLKNLNNWGFDPDVFISNDLKGLNGWKKFMLINLDTFIKVFKEFKR